MDLKSTLQWAKHELIAVSDTPSLDAEILLAHVLNVSRSYLLAFSERELTSDEFASFKKLIAKRAQHIPLAYCTGHREFWSLDFIVTDATLIPRPETELLVELTLKKIQGEHKIIADLGTGSGAIALALAVAQPTWTIYAIDASSEALQIAQLNAQRLQIKNVIFRQGNWCDVLPHIQFDAIVSNPPYIAPDDPHLQGALLHEPRAALVSTENGLYDLRHIIHAAREYLCTDGVLLLEHGSEQDAQIKNFFMDFGYHHIELHRDLAGLPRVTCAQKQ